MLAAAGDWLRPQGVFVCSAGRTPSWVPMTARAVLTGDAGTGYALWWFVGVTTVPRKRDAQVGHLTERETSRT